MQNTRLRNYLAAAAIAAVLGGCGSSDHDDGPGGGTGGPGGGGANPTTDVPSSAQSSVDALIAYMNEVIRTMTNDTSEPILVGDAVLPTSESTEPGTVNP